MSPVAKVAKMVPKIGTHNGTFHCDEALACFMLKMTSYYHDAEVVRTRDQTILDTCDIVVDVGGIFDPEKSRFDHHQKGFEHTMKSLLGMPFQTKLSSAGLVYAHYGKEIISNLVGCGVEDAKVQVLYRKVYEKFMEAIDAVDNGVSATEETPKYAVTTTLSSRVSNLNPWWNKKDIDENTAFQKAMALTGAEFSDKIDYFANCWWPARDEIRKTVQQRFEVHKSGKVLCFESGGFPWKEHLFEMEGEEKVDPQPLFVVYPENPGGKWRIQTIPLSANEPFKFRLGLPESWRGLRESELDEACGVGKSVFCHISGFIAGNTTKEGIMQMVQKALAQN